MPRATRTSGLAIAGFVCSFFCGLLGLILSITGRNECKRSGGTVGGEGLALAGIIISSISLVLGVLGVLGVLAAVAIPAFMDYTKRSKSIEADLYLMRLERTAKRYALENKTFPRRSAPLTPATPCCAGPGARCSDPQSWATPEWLDFAIDEPHRFQYSYESDGNTFTAHAAGDVRRDGHAVSYELRGTLDGSGDPTFSLTAPPMAR
jgi:type II secretory pathway pseudopilin PulG